MVAEEKIKKLLFILLAVTLVLYILITELLLSVTFCFSGDVSIIDQFVFPLKLVSFISSISFTLFTARSGFIAKKFLREKYIAGIYEGQSKKNSRDNELLDTHIEKLNIVQSLLFIKISGESRDCKNECYALWDGFAIFADKDTDRYDFIVRINYNRGLHTGILELTIRDGQLKGYHPARQGKWSMNLERVG